MEQSILLMGFRPWHPYPVNVSEQIARSLDTKVIETQDGVHAKIKSIILPLNYKTFRYVLQKALQDIRPSIAVGLGMSFCTTPHLAFEVKSYQMSDYPIDNIIDETGIVEKNLPLDNITSPLFLPYRSQLEKRLQDMEKIKISENAGNSLCHATLRDLIRISENGRLFQPAFLHLVQTPKIAKITQQEYQLSVSSMIEEEQIEIIIQVLEVLLSEKQENQDK